MPTESAPETAHPPAASRQPAYLMASLLGASGLGHFAAPDRFDAALPTELPGNLRVYTYASGVLEIAISTLLILPGTRRAGARAAATFFILIVPVIVNGLRLARGKGWPAMLAATARLPVHVAMIAIALRIVRGA